MTASNTFGRAVVWALTNKSGGGVVAGDVVIVDTANNDAFTTTTSASSTAIVGIATGTIASNAVGLILLQGYASLVNVNASVTRGHYGATYTVAKQATDAGTSRTTGTFCQFLTGGTTPDAILFNTDLLGSSLSNPMNAKGQMIQGDTGGTPSALAVGTVGQVLTSGGSGAFNTWTGLRGVKAYKTAQTVTDAMLAFDNELWDTDGFHDNVTANTKFTIPTGLDGYYAVQCSGFVSTTTARLEIWINGAIARGRGSVSANNYAVTWGIFSLAATNYVEIKGVSGGSTAYGDAGNVGDNLVCSVTRIGV